MKKIFGSLLLMLVIFASASAMAVEIGDGWTLDDNGVLTITMEKVDPYSLGVDKNSVKSVIIEEGAVSVAYGAFYGMNNITSISFPSTVTKIDEDFSWDCDNLSVITVEEGNTVYSSQDGMLMSADKTKLLEYPQGKTDKVFEVPDCVTEIQAFLNNKYMEKLILHSGIEFDNSVSYCKALKEIQVDSDNPYHTTVDGVLYNKDMSELQAYPPGKQSDVYEFPDTVTTVQGMIFAHTHLKRVDIPNTVTNIDGELMFYRSGVEEVRLPEGIKEIGDDMFYECTGLKKVYVPEGVTRIGHSAFYRCSHLKNIDFLPSSVTEIDNEAFLECKGLETVIIPQNVVSLGKFAFSECGYIDKIILSDKMTEIPQDCFSHCSGIEEIYIPEGIKTIYRDAFGGRIENAHFPNSIETIYDIWAEISNIYYNGTEEEWKEVTENRNQYMWSWDNLYCVPTALFLGEITSEPSEGGYKITAGLKHISDGDILVAAVYDENGLLAGVSSETLETGEESHCVDVSAEGAHTAKLFLWNSLDEMVPFCAARDIILQ